MPPAQHLPPEQVGLSLQIFSKFAPLVVIQKNIFSIFIKAPLFFRLNSHLMLLVQNTFGKILFTEKPRIFQKSSFFTLLHWQMHSFFALYSILRNILITNFIYYSSKQLKNLILLRQVNKSSPLSKQSVTYKNNKDQSWSLSIQLKKKKTRFAKSEY